MAYPLGRLSIDRDVDLGTGRLLHRLVMVTQLRITLEGLGQMFYRGGGDSRPL